MLAPQAPRRQADQGALHTTGKSASSTDPATWSTFEACLAALESGKADGIGLVLDGSDDLVGVDLDDCLTGSTLKPWAQAIAERLNSYTEITPSGEGVRIFVRGKLPADGRKKGDVEFYRAKRFLTITGHHLKPFPRTIKRRSKVVAAVHTEIFGASLERVRPNGPTEWSDAQWAERFPLHSYPSPSERDHAIICAMLRAGHSDAEITMAIQAVRADQKALERADYIPRSIAKARAAIAVRAEQAR